MTAGNEMEWGDEGNEIELIYCPNHLSAPKQLTSIGLAGVCLVYGFTRNNIMCMFSRNLVGISDNMAIFISSGWREKREEKISRPWVICGVSFKISLYRHKVCVCVSVVCVCV